MVNMRPLGKMKIPSHEEFALDSHEYISKRGWVGAPYGLEEEVMDILSRHQCEGETLDDTLERLLRRRKTARIVEFMNKKYYWRPFKRRRYDLRRKVRL